MWRSLLEGLGLGVWEEIRESTLFTDKTSWKNMTCFCGRPGVLLAKVWCLFFFWLCFSTTYICQSDGPRPTSNGTFFDSKLSFYFSPKKEKHIRFSSSPLPPFHDGNHSYEPLHSSPSSSTCNPPSLTTHSDSSAAPHSSPASHPGAADAPRVSNSHRTPSLLLRS